MCIPRKHRTESAVMPPMTTRLFELKGRSQAKGATVLISDISESLRYIEVSAKAQELMNTYWPGALNIIAPIKQGSPISTRCAQEGTQSVRVSSYPVASALVCALGRPLVSSSANLAGEGDVYCASDVEIEADAIIDAGELEYNRPSTIVRTVDDKIEILRQGEIKIGVVTR